MGRAWSVWWSQIATVLFLVLYATHGSTGWNSTRSTLSATGLMAWTPRASSLSIAEGPREKSASASAHERTGDAGARGGGA